jgi:hypothetical protein
MIRKGAVREDGSSPREVLAECSESDFDGHSAFAALSPRERLAWLERAGALLRAMKRHSRVKSS